MEKPQLEELAWFATNLTTPEAKASALAGLAISEAVQKFERSNDKVGRRMLQLTWALVVLTTVLVVLTGWIIRKA